MSNLLSRVSSALTVTAFRSASPGWRIRSGSIMSGHLPRSSKPRATCIYRLTELRSWRRSQHPVRKWLVQPRHPRPPVAYFRGCAEFSAFDLPLGMMRGEKFEQPIFGCNHLKGEIAPLPPVSTILNPTGSTKRRGCAHWNSAASSCDAI